MEEQLDEKIESLSSISDLSKLAEYKKQIVDLVTKKAEIAGDASPKGSYLRELREERRQYESQLNSGTEFIKAPKSGIVSYKVDGLETVLTTTDFSTLSKNYLESLNLKTGKTIATNEECGKIIDNFSCYIATVLNSENAKQAKIGDKVKIRLSNNVEIDAKITYLIQENEDEVLIVLQINNQTNELINYRKISFDFIWWKHSGLKVPNDAIVEQDNLKYVVRNRAGYLSKILIKVKKQNDNYAIIDNYSTEELKELGYSSKQINAFKKITIYDEIVINPNLEKID